MRVAPGPSRGTASVRTGKEGRSVAAMVLTGGASRRMGWDKMEIPVGGVPCAEVVARAARAVAGACVEVGPGRTSLTRVVEQEPGRGPLAAISTGWSALVDVGEGGPVLVLAGDLPLVTPELLAWLAGCTGAGSVVPVVEGRRQPLLARWSAEAPDEAGWAAAAGALAVGGRPFGAREVEPGEWGRVTGGDSFADLDTPADVLRLVGPEGLRPPTEGVPAGRGPAVRGGPAAVGGKA